MSATTQATGIINDELIKSDLAVIVKEIPNHNSLMDYVKGVAALIGSNNVCGIFKDKGYIKIYLKDKKNVETVVNSGIIILGHHANVEFAVPRSTKVILSNIDPAIPDIDVKKLLTSYGTLESDVIHQKISNEVEYSHIYCGVRYAYMSLHDKSSFPNKLNWMYGGTWHTVDVIIDEPPEEKVNAESVDVSAETTGNVSSESKSQKTSKQPSERQLAYRNRGRLLPRGRFRKRGGRWAGHVIGQNSTAKSIAANQIRKHARKFGRRGPGRGKNKVISSVRRPVSSSSKDSDDSAQAESTSTEPMCRQSDQSDGDCFQESVSEPYSNNSQFKLQAKHPLSMKKLREFLLQVKHHRNPVDVALSYLKENGTPDATKDLIQQLNECYNIASENKLKSRLSRLISVLNEKLI